MIIGNPRPDTERVPRRYRGSAKGRKFIAGGLLAIFALLAIAILTPLLTGADEKGLASRTMAKLTRSAKAKPPEIAPVELVEIDADQARRINAGVPFAAGPAPSAKPFALADGAEDQGRARDCMASALYYEAGDDPLGQSAVAQVIANRVRHPAFPKSICAVVYQGAERSTGCQFTFTCDGAMQGRTPSPAQWVRAQAVAQLTLTGVVNRMVGTATHYHTDWVVPTWSASLDKVARVGTHLFFRWHGGWGRPAAFRSRPDTTEPIIPQMAALSPLHRPASLTIETLPLDDAPPHMDATASRGANFPAEAARSSVDLKGHRIAHVEGSTYMMALNVDSQPGSYALAALALCRGKPTCTVLGWLDPARVPIGAIPDEQSRGTMTFRYARNGNSAESVKWNCNQIARPDPTQCL
jgi:hypothetical protein